MASYRSYVARRKLRTAASHRETPAERHAAAMRQAETFVALLRKHGLQQARVWSRPGAHDDVRVYVYKDAYVVASGDPSGLHGRVWLGKGGVKHTSFDAFSLPDWVTKKYDAAMREMVHAYASSFDARNDADERRLRELLPAELLAERRVGSFDLRVVYDALEDAHAQLWVRKDGDAHYLLVPGVAAETLEKHWDATSAQPDAEQERELAQAWLDKTYEFGATLLHRRAQAEENPMDEGDDLEDSHDDEDDDLAAAVLRGNPAGHAYLSLPTIERWEPLARELGVSVVARSARGFLPAYRRAGGRASNLSEYWRRRREGFVARHMAQVEAQGEPLWQDGAPTRRHLALIMWAYSPTARRL